MTDLYMTGDKKKTIEINMRLKYNKLYKLLFISSVYVIKRVYKLKFVFIMM
jgi:hypothetical protein